MSVAVCVFIVTLSTLHGKVVSGILRSPTNVQVTSRDLNLVLSWDPPADAPSGLIYTTEFKSSVTNSPGCVNITTFQCELSRFDISYYGTYRAKVRALLGEEASAWVESKEITLDKDTLISPPSVSLLPIGQILEVSIKDPEFKISSLRNVYSRVNYNITYWKQGQEEQVRTLSNIHQDRVVLDNLDPSTNYCVQVRIITLRNRNSIEPSSVLCERTGETDNSAVVAAVITCVVIAVAVAVTVLAVVKWKCISHFLWPKVSLPRHFEKSLLATPESSVCLITQPTEEIASVSVLTVEESSHEGTKESHYNKQLNGSMENNSLHPAC